MVNGRFRIQARDDKVFRALLFFLVSEGYTSFPGPEVIKRGYKKINYLC